MSNAPGSSPPRRPTRPKQAPPSDIVRPIPRPATPPSQSFEPGQTPRRPRRRPPSAGAASALHGSSIENTVNIPQSELHGSEVARRSRSPKRANLRSESDTIVEPPSQPPRAASAPTRPTPANAPSEFVRAAGASRKEQVSGDPESRASRAPGSAPRGLVKPGQQLGKYIIQSELGRGAMGLVMTAEHIELRHMVALKILPPSFNAQQDVVTRFQREAEAVARLNHPNIIRLYEYGQDQELHFYAMELCKGHDLSKTIKTERMAYADAAGLIAKCADALHYAHELAVIHRDIKPANILIDERNEPRLTDFGLARLDGASSLTMKGSVLGTPLYMSPEQATADQRLTRQTDIYSLGATLYELATGKAPYKGRDAHNILLQVLSKGPSDPRSADPYMPENLAVIIRKAIARDPKNRYETARDFAEDLKAFANDQPLVLNAGGPSKSTLERRNVLIFGAVGFLALALIGGFIHKISERAGSSRAQQIADLEEKLEALKLSRRGPTAPTPDLDADTGESVPLTKQDRQSARLIASDRNVHAKRILTQRNLPEIPEDMRQRARELIIEARSREQDGDAASAEVLVGEALRLDAGNNDVMFYQARLAAENGDFEKAIELFTLLILDERSDTELENKARFERGMAYQAFEDAAYDVLAEEDLSTVEGDLKWQSQIELIKLHVLRQRFDFAYLSQEDLLKRIRQFGVQSKGLLGPDEVAECYFRQAQLILKLGKSREEARGLAELARERSVDDDLLDRIEELIDILEAPPEPGQEAG